MTTSMPAACSSEIAARELSRTPSGTADEAGGPPIDRDDDGGASTGGNFVTAPTEGAEWDAFPLHEPQAPNRDPPSADLRNCAVPGDILELLRSGEIRAATLRIIDDRLGQGVFGLPLDRGSESKQFVVVHPVGQDISDLRLALGQRAGLVHDDNLDTSGSLEGHRVF